MKPTINKHNPARTGEAIAQPDRSRFLLPGLVISAAALVSCATSPEPRRAARHAPGERTSATPAASPPATSPAAASPRACSKRPATRPSCAPEDGCVWDRSGSGCRDAANACERVKHLTRDYGYKNARWWTPHGRATFLGGDPCAAVDPRCAFDVGKVLCQPFVALDRCPATARAARAQRVFCLHPKQPALTCRYKDDGGVTFSCRRPPRPLSGRMPPPGSHDIPVGWFEQRDYDDNGCPLSTRALEAPCTASQKQQCRSGLSVLQCIRGRWRGTRTLPPPP